MAFDFYIDVVKFTLDVNLPFPPTASYLEDDSDHSSGLTSLWFGRLAAISPRSCQGTLDAEINPVATFEMRA